MSRTNLLRYEGNSDQWEVNDFTLVTFVECSSWCRVGEPDNCTALFRQHLNILKNPNASAQWLQLLLGRAGCQIFDWHCLGSGQHWLLHCHVLLLWRHHLGCHNWPTAASLSSWSPLLLHHNPLLLLLLRLLWLLLLLLLLNQPASTVCSMEHHSTTPWSLLNHLSRHWCHLVTCTLRKHQSAWCCRWLVHSIAWLRHSDNSLPWSCNLHLGHHCHFLLWYWYHHLMWCWH